MDDNNRSNDPRNYNKTDGCGNKFLTIEQRLKEEMENSIEEIYTIDSSEVGVEQDLLAVSTNVVLNSKIELNDICRIVDKVGNHTFGLLFERDSDGSIAMIFTPDSTSPKEVYQMYAMVYGVVGGVVGEVRKEKIEEDIEDVAQYVYDTSPEEVSLEEVMEKIGS